MDSPGVGSDPLIAAGPLHAINSLWPELSSRKIDDLLHGVPKPGCFGLSFSTCKNLLAHFFQTSIVDVSHTELDLGPRLDLRAKSACVFAIIAEILTLQAPIGPDLILVTVVMPS